MITPIHCGVVLLAAGRSERMGKFKLLLPWSGTSILGHQLHLWEELGAHQIGVVCAKEGSAVRAELNRLGFPKDNLIPNPEPDRGMFSSIRCAAQWRGWDGALTHWVITLGDQPHLRFETLQTLLKFGAAHPGKVCQPRWLGRLHHPVLLPRTFFHQLTGTCSDTLKNFLKGVSEHVAGCDIDDAGLGFDVDTPQDYERALSGFGQPGESGHDSRAGRSV